VLVLVEAGQILWRKKSEYDTKLLVN